MRSRGPDRLPARRRADGAGGRLADRNQDRSGPSSAPIFVRAGVNASIARNGGESTLRGTPEMRRPTRPRVWPSLSLECARGDGSVVAWAMLASSRRSSKQPAGVAVKVSTRSIAASVTRGLVSRCASGVLESPSGPRWLTRTSWAQRSWSAASAQAFPPRRDPRSPARSVAI